MCIPHFHITFINDISGISKESSVCINAMDNFRINSSSSRQRRTQSANDIRKHICKQSLICKQDALQTPLKSLTEIPKVAIMHLGIEVLIST